MPKVKSKAKTKPFFGKESLGKEYLFREKVSQNLPLEKKALGKNKMNMNKQNKKETKAWIRVIEAFLASIIVIGAVFAVISSQDDPKTDISKTVGERQEKILEIIRSNDILRGYVLDNNISAINATIEQMIPPSWNFATNICDINLNCPNPAIGVYEKNVDIFVRETSIFTDSTEYKPKKLVFFVWSE